MLKYQIKLTDDSFKQEELVWGEKYLAPDLSFVSGVTSQHYHLEKFKKLPLTNKFVNNNNALATLETKNVTRQGYIVIKDKSYEVNSGSVIDYSVDSGGTPIFYHYLFLNGKYYYSYELEDGSYTDFKITNWFTENTEYVEDSDEFVTNVSENTISLGFDGSDVIGIDTIAWIEDGIVSIDGHDYYFDREEQIDNTNRGGLKYYENGACLDYSAITECSSIEFHPFESSNDYIEVTKLKLTKEEELNEDFEKISFCKRFYYVKYKDYYFPIRFEDNLFVCDVPNYVLGTDKEITDAEYYQTEKCYVYHINEYSEEEILSGATFDDLLNDTSFIKFEDKKFEVEYDVMNANDGKEIAIYLVGDTTNIAIGDRIRIVDSSDTAHTQYVYTVDTYGFSADDTDFVLFDGKKYKVEKNLCDKVIINGNEYSIDYINGKEESGDCLVLIGEEKVPMYITSVSDGEYSAGTLTRYGKIVSGDSKSAITATYDIIPYDGITVGKKRYLLSEETIINEADDKVVEQRRYARLDRSNEYTFFVEDIKGSSMVICMPDINSTDFTDEFNNFISKEICKDVVDNQMYMLLYTKNKIFGNKEIREELVFQNYLMPFDEDTAPTSSDDYFNLFDNLQVFSKNGYIHIPLALSNSQGNDIIQDDIVEKQFFEEVKNNAINPIVDMEKDVYYPKYILNSDKSIMEFLSASAITPDERRTYQHAYIGSYTDFHPIREIRVNPHFRTRNLDSWKVNDGLDDISVANVSDNWFITDMHPYRDVLDSSKPNSVLYHYVYPNNSKTPRITGMTKAESIEQLYNTSDLVGLLYFSNDDVFFQKTKIAKSFLRFSYYDSTNPQTQSLMATSTVFMDEHKLFKTFIDNSRKNVSDYGLINSVEYAVGSDGRYNLQKDIALGSTIRKVSVLSEYLGERKDNRDRYLNRHNPYVEFNGVIIDDDHRIGSEFIIDNKIVTDTSSEGYYLYIFRDYSENLHPKPIYMKVEFNHAGIGHTIPFLIPMEWETPEGGSENGKRVPRRPLTLVPEDRELLTQGIRLEDVYMQTYIPLYAVYDFKNKEYAYVFDNRYATQNEDNVLILNLFELKVMNDTDNSEEAKSTVSIKTQPTATIDVNRNQFPEI